MALHYHNLLAEYNFWVDVPENGDLVSYKNPFGKDVLVKCDLYLKTANGATLTIDIGVSNVDPPVTNDGLIDGGNLNGTAEQPVARGTDGREWKLLREDSAIVIDLSGTPAAALDAMINFVAYPYNQE